MEIINCIRIAVIIGCLIYLLILKKKNLATMLLSALFLVLLLARIGIGWLLTVQHRNLEDWDTISNTVDITVILAIINTLVMLIITVFFLLKIMVKKKQQSMNKQDEPLDHIG
ncbi:MAG: hypothetical protein ACOX8Q_09190 [Christensenellales bacterium]|jgi:cytochrome bd-type quinol oxidase subunit 2